MKKILLLPLVFISLLSFSLLQESFGQTMNDINIVPRPAEMKLGKGYYIFDKFIDIIFNDVGSADIAYDLSARLKKLYGFNLQVCEYHSYKYRKQIVVDEETDYKSKDGYEINII
jgi:hypothetical protein